MNRIIKNKHVTIALLVAFIVLFVCSIVGAFLYVPTASAMSSVTKYTTTKYLAQSPFYNAGFQFNNLLNTWYFEFDVGSNSMGFYMYIVDHNYNDVPSAVNMVGRPFDDLSTTSDYFTTKYGTGERYGDYVLKYRLDNEILSTTPKYLTISYTSVITSPYDWTVKRLYTDQYAEYTESNFWQSGYILTTYLWGNDYYEVSYSFVQRTANDFAKDLNDNPNKVVSDTMYYSADVLESNQYENGYNAGFTAGKQNATINIDKDSASYKQGVIDGASENNPFSFVGLFGAIADSQLTLIDGFLGFDFLGVNVLSLFKVIITMGIVYGVFRLIKG